MFKTGLVSVTFRQLEPAAIIDLCRQAVLDGIEWGGDIHVPHGDLDRARAVGRLTRAAGLAIPSYGSYYRAGVSEPEGLAFPPVLATAVALQAANIRIWAGKLGSGQADENLWQQVIEDTKRVCGLAGRAGLTVSFEYHDGTLTDTPETALRLAKAVDCANLRLYWQPAVGLTAAARLAGLQLVQPWLSHCHVFHWSGQDRLPLADGRAEWRQYLDQMRTDQNLHYCLLEFVRNSDPDQFLADGAILRELLAE